MLEILFLIIGLLAGAIVGGGYFYTKYTSQSAKLAEENNRVMAEAYANKRLLVDKIAELDGVKEEVRLQELRLMNLNTERARMTIEVQQWKEKFEARDKEVEGLQEQFRMEFENIASRILTQNSEQLSISNSNKINDLLSPLKEKLQSFEKKVEETYQQEAKERFHLQKELASLHQLNQQLSFDANNLTKALKNDSKTQGNWGELVLTKILENTGLREGQEFVIQGKDMVLNDEQGNRQQPDVILNLPDNRHIIIDSKVSLTAYERYINAETELEQKAFLKKHIESLTSHIIQLGAKHYDALPGLLSPDFVLMFLPLESAFSVAINQKPDLFHKAFEQKIVIVSPTTLLATLKTVSSIWKMEHQNRNAADIARQGGLLYDKLMAFTEEIERIGKGLKQANDGYENALHRLTTGRDSLLNRAEKLKDLGVKSTKKLPNNLKDKYLNEQEIVSTENVVKLYDVAPNNANTSVSDASAS